MPPKEFAVLAKLRAAGWMVAVHNDYRQGGALMTFWGFSRGDRFLKGEGPTDAEALAIVADQADLFEALSPPATPEKGGR